LTNNVLPINSGVIGQTGNFGFLTYLGDFMRINIVIKILVLGRVCFSVADNAPLGEIVLSNISIRRSIVREGVGVSLIALIRYFPATVLVLCLQHSPVERLDGFGV